MDNPYKIILKPLITEKGTLQTEVNNCYTFQVHPKANRAEIAKAIETLFNVHVLKVNTLVRKGKRMGRGNRIYNRQNLKRAIVKLREGEAIEFI